ncbi:MAG: uracil-DNA glycosylase family protein [Comamonas sp.]
MPPTATLTLDARQRAMLAEMGIRLWQPGAEAPVADDAPPPRRGIAEARPARVPAPSSVVPAVPAAPTPASVADRASAASARPTTASPVPAPAAATPPPVAPVGHAASNPGSSAPSDATDPSTLDWPALQTWLAQDAWPAGQARVLSGQGDTQATWLFINDAASSPPPRGAAPAAPPTEQLLDNMLRACGLSRQAGAFLAYAHPLPEQVADPEALLRAWLEQVVQALRPCVVVLMSRAATHSLLQTREAPGRLRGQALTACGVPVVVSYPPALLLGKAENKRRAWADLCRARAIVEG